MSITEKLDILAPFEIWEVLLDNTTIKFHEPLMLQPVPLPDDPEEPSRPGENRYWLVECPELDISTCGEDRREMHNGILSDIRDAWKHIVSIPDDKISPRGKKIKEAYLAIAEEVMDE